MWTKWCIRTRSNSWASARSSSCLKDNDRLTRTRPVAKEVTEMKTRSKTAANPRSPKFIRLGLVGVLVGALVACAFFNMLQPQEPKYQGKPISLWIRVYQNQFS